MTMRERLEVILRGPGACCYMSINDSKTSIDDILNALMSPPLEILIIGENVVTGGYGDAPDFHAAWLAAIRAIKEGK